MFEPGLQEQIQRSVISGLNATCAELSLPIVFGHLCKGSLDSPGVLRVSGVAGGTLTLRGQQTTCTHQEAFQRHVRRFGRQNTLLNWLVCWTREFFSRRIGHDSSYSTSISFMVRRDGGELISIEERLSALRITVSETLFRSLVPEGLAVRYLSYLYGMSEDSTLFCGHNVIELELLTAKLQSLLLVGSCQSSLSNIDTLCGAYLQGTNGSTLQSASKNSHRLQLLCAIQIAFAYSEVFSKEKFDEGGFVSVCRSHEASIVPNDARSLSGLATIVISTCINCASRVDEIEKQLLSAAIKEPLVGALYSISEMKGAAASRGEKICLTSKFSSDSAQLLAASLAKHVPNPPCKAWTENAAAWVAHLVSSLRGAKHEGEPLEFTFVLADIAQIEDSPHIERLSLIDVGFVFPPGHEETDEVRMIELLATARKVIEKENYFWFQKGRYALLWDFAFPQLQPSYLIALKDSSWQVFVDNARNRVKPTTAAIALVVGYLDERGGGGLIVGGEQVLSLTKDGKWIERGEALAVRIEAYLRAAGDAILDDIAIATLTKSLVAVSNDPDTGCMLVVANSSECPPFQSMGSQWKVCAVNSNSATGFSDRLRDLSDEKLVALLGMDGAACVWNDGTDCRVAFRKLVRPPEDSDKTRPEFKSVKDELSGEGSRKWSAYLAARRTDINLIVAVSQDGPVHFYATCKVAKIVWREGLSQTSFSNCSDSEAVIHDRIG